MATRFLLLFALLFLGSVRAQSPLFLEKKHEKYLQELRVLNKSENTVNKRGIGNFFLTLYQKHISVLISADCLYEISCSRYSRLAINKHGFVKGLFLTADRLTRCSASCSKDIPDNKFNDDGLAQDNP